MGDHKDDEFVEPPNSTVNDWHGQKVSDDEAMIDEVLEETARARGGVTKCQATCSRPTPYNTKIALAMLWPVRG